MKPVKLLTLTTGSYLIIFSALILIFFAILYSLIRKEVLGSADEILYNKKQHGIELFRRNGHKLSSERLLYSDFYIEPTRKHKLTDIYSDTTLFESVDREWDDFRKLTSYAEVDGNLYKIVIVVPLLEMHEIVDGIVESLVIIFVLMILVFFLATRFLSKNLWRPFYDTVDVLNQYRIENLDTLNFSSTRIAEFEILNKSIEKLTHRTRGFFQSQKQFIENASHEMQTPLAILRSKQELLIADPNLTQHQSEIVQTLINTTERLTRLNKTLQLLSKIENRQFIDKETLVLGPLIEQTLSYFEEQRDSLAIVVTLEIHARVSVSANRTLLELLFTNLIKNAFFHNIPGGSVHIFCNTTSFMISNTSSVKNVDESKIFERFYKHSTSKESWGLGLSIVKNICEINHWTINYANKDGLHTFTVAFMSNN